MRKVSERLHIAPQLSADDIRRAKREGIAAIINNRPDGEEPGQPDAAGNAAVAAAEGLGYVHIPVVPGRILLEQVRGFQRALAAAPGPVLAHCKTGTRSATLHVIGEVLDGRMAKADVIPFGRGLGLDLSGAVAWLDANRR